MSNEIIDIDPVNKEIVDGAGKFVDLLASDSFEKVRPTINIIPNVIKDILDISLEHKELKIKDRNYKRKTELVKEYLNVLNQHSQRSYNIKLREIESEFALVNAKIDSERQSKIYEIESEKEYQICKIKSSEKVSIKEINNKYKLEMKKIESKKNAFDKWLKITNNQFKRKMKSTEKLQNELTIIINTLITKMQTKTLNDYEYNLLSHFTKLKVQALENSFNLEMELIKFFSSEED